MHTATWQLHDARKRFSEVVELARTKGRQTITKHGKPVVVMLSVQEFSDMERRKPKAKTGESLVKLLRRCPAPEVFDVTGKSRPHGKARDLDLWLNERRRMRCLLDANILSEGRKKRPEPKVLSWLLQNAPASGLSVLTIGEFVKGASVIPAGRRRRRLEAWIVELEQEFSGRLLPLDVREMRTWGHLYGEPQAAGKTPPLFDSLLAATTRSHNLTFVTRNTADIANAGVTVLDPFN